MALGTVEKAIHWTVYIAVSYKSYHCIYIRFMSCCAISSLSRQNPKGDHIVKIYPNQNGSIKVVYLKLLFSLAGSTDSHQHDMDQCGEWCTCSKLY